jgi:hypothetical protein
MTDLRTAAQQALEALETVFMPHHPAVISLRAALEQPEQPEQPEQEPVVPPELEAHFRHLDAQMEQEPVAYTGDVARRMREAGMTFHLGMPHSVVMEQMTRFHDLVCAEVSIKAAVAFAHPPRREPEQEPVAWCDPAEYDDFQGAVSRNCAAANSPKRHAPVTMETVYETIIHWDEGGGKRSRRELARRIVSLFTHPPRREWRSLSEEEISRAYFASASHTEYARAIETALRSKNHE